AEHAHELVPATELHAHAIEARSTRDNRRLRGGEARRGNGDLRSRDVRIRARDVEASALVGRAADDAARVEADGGAAHGLARHGVDHLDRDPDSGPQVELALDDLTAVQYEVRGAEDGTIDRFDLCAEDAGRDLRRAPAAELVRRALDQRREHGLGLG